MAIKIEMQSNAGYILKAELTGCTDELNAGCEKRGESLMLLRILTSKGAVIPFATWGYWRRSFYV